MKTQSNAASEPGNLIMLGLGVWVFVLALVFVIGSAASLHNARKDLLAESDALALAVAQELSDAAYYSGSSELYTSQSVQVAIAERGVDPRFRIAQPNVVAGGSVVVSLSTDVNLPFVPDFLEAIDEVSISATSYARLRKLP